MTTPRSVATELRQVLAALDEQGLLAFYNTVSEDAARVCWHSPVSHADFLLSRSDLTIRGYLHWLETSQFSGLLFDGSLLQVTYDFDGHSIVGHRLAYVPCPVDLTSQDCRELLDEGFPWGDVVRMQLERGEDILMKSSLRFDYDPRSAAADHPETHFTMNSTECRIACATPFRFGRFLDFVFRTFYPSLYAANPYLQGFPKDGWFEGDIAEVDRELIHFAWA